MDQTFPLSTPIMHYVVFCIWPVSLSSVVFLKVIHAVVCICTLFLLLLSNFPLYGHYQIFFIHSSVNAHLDCFQLAIVSVAAMKMYASFCVNMYIPRSGIAQSYGNSTFTYWRNYPTAF